MEPAAGNPSTAVKATLLESEAWTALWNTVAQRATEAAPVVCAALENQAGLTVPDALKSVELALALLSLELRAVANLCPPEQAQRIFGHVRSELGQGSEAEWAINALDVYRQRFDLAVSQGRENPVEGVAEALIERLLGPASEKVKSRITGRTDFVLTMEVGLSLAGLCGIWRNILSEREVVHSVRNARISFSLLTQKVHLALDRYILVHDALFKKSLRKILPIPGLFQPIPFTDYERNLHGIASDLATVQTTLHASQAQTNADRMRETILNQYVIHLTSAIEQLRLICERQAAVAAGTGRYALGDYQRDCASYQTAVTRYTEAGQRLNAALVTAERP